MSDQHPHSHSDDLACVEEVEVMTDYLEGTLPPTEAKRLELHLETCPGCTEYMQQMKSLAGSLGELGGDSIPAEMRDGLMAAFREFRKTP